MPTKTSAPTVKKLQSLLARIGSVTAGKREVLVNRLNHDLGKPRMSISKRATRILSIDMGIKNLAFCVADVKGGETLKNSGEVEMKIQAWRRLDVAEEVFKSSQQLLSSKTNENLEEDEQDPYAPSALSRTAYALLTHSLLPFNPDIILIERQRWRSASGIAIQQWTVRVNTLEGMLWAILTALRVEARKKENKGESNSSRTYDVFGVDPKRVGFFWIGEEVRAMALNLPTAIVEDMASGPKGGVGDIIGNSKKPLKKLSRGKAEKKAKIQLVRSWLSSNPPRTTVMEINEQNDGMKASIPTISFAFSNEADTTKKALCVTILKDGERVRARDGVIDLKKLDDVADCFLQAAAFVAWERNRQTLKHDWDTKNGRLRDFDTKNGKKLKPRKALK
ncbi:ribonuclease H-like protein [Lojkania enalia]|uniref:Ribonuclease H-like protein n=1 Tax=Lojkania enalia TaxID=147567 RepID=A0A9P4TPY2_9PLEO|nr:ribonuclease H-like protein [Didymosphaeria enalia]